MYCYNVEKGGDNAVTEGIIIAVITAVVTLFGNLITNSKSTNIITYRISQLEKKQDKNNSLIERMVKVEQSVKSAHHRIDEIEKCD